ncbi:methionine/alanine import family NSS transporter small subunit [Actinotalea sp. C106]|uniref:methionine/alanine import family NSS transporter small subunit n=1 Tax=Actinotalea sp. C106 TaxID=2908644 RepID=UPI002028E1BA|nr:methionine/alanine import family NSS transporter small subunit [Actinotalea sp. C106]
MTTTAVLVMVVSLLVVWGGLALSIWRLRRDTRQDDAAAAGDASGTAEPGHSSPAPGGAPQP